jgi:hypothetical protein
MKCDYEPVQAIPCVLCVFDIMGNHPTGETFPLCKIPARYLLSTSSLLNRPVKNYIQIPIYPITHLHTMILHQSSGSEDTDHTIGKNLIGIAGHLPPSQPRSTRRSRRVLIPRVDTRKTSETDSVSVSRGDVEGF